MLFFISILIGGRGSILGPLLGTMILTALPEFAAPLVQWSTFLYAVLLLVIVLAMPGGIAELLDFRSRKPLAKHREIRPRPELLTSVLGSSRPAAAQQLREKGTSVILVEQFIEKAIRISDRVYALVGGKMVISTRGDEPELAKRLERAHFGHD